MGWLDRWKWLARRIRPLTLGQRGEAIAAKFLQRNGYQLVARSLRRSMGEIDLIAVDGRTVVFVEVKTRRSHERGHPSDAVDSEKQGRLTRLALVWLKRHGLLEYSARFDVVAITCPDDHGAVKVEHFKNAFEAQGRWQMFS